jgi:hypothetical protein
MSDLALVGFTGARLPSDGFSFAPEFPLNLEPCEFILEVAGVRHNYGNDISDILEGDLVSFVPDPSNEVDRHAIGVNLGGRRMGYVNRAMIANFRLWMTQGTVMGRVERKNGKAGRPMVYVRVLANILEAVEPA